MRIRRVRHSDDAGWLGLRLALYPGFDEPTLRGEMDEIAGNPDRTAVFVADGADGRTAGFVEASIRELPPGCGIGRAGHIESWYVLPHLRRQGVGRRLVQVAEAWAREMGCTEMGSDCDCENEISRSAHAALGYQETSQLVHFRKSLGGGA